MSWSKIEYFKGKCILSLEKYRVRQETKIQLKDEDSTLSIFQVKECMNIHSHQSIGDHTGNHHKQTLKQNVLEPILLSALPKMQKLNFITISQSTNDFSETSVRNEISARYCDLL